MRQAGAVPSQMIAGLIDRGAIAASEDIPSSNLQPASLDLRLGLRGWKVKAAFLPLEGESILQALDRYALESFELNEPYVLELGQTYVIETAEYFDLPENVHAYTNNKSTTGRMNIWVRTLVDSLPRFDKISAGYKGKAYVMVTPRSWPVRVKSGNTLNQIRLLVGDNHLLDLELSNLHEALGLVYDCKGNKCKAIIDNGLLLTVDLCRDVVGYEAINCHEPVDLTDPTPKKAENYFKPLYGNCGEVLLKKNSFYILCTKEFLRVPLSYAVEMVAYDIHSGEYRSHYAGFFDPGFGFGSHGEVAGTPAVLELDTHEDVVFRDGQPICKMVYEYMLKDSEKNYGSELGSHYQNQRGPQLGRHFV